MMKNFSFNLDLEKIRGAAGRIVQLGGGPRVLAAALIAAAALYASVDLVQKIAHGMEGVPSVHKPAAARPAADSAVKKPPEAYQAIAARNLFGSTDKESAWTGGGASFAAAEARQTTLQLELLGTVAGSDPYSRAVIDDKTAKRPRVFKLGDQVGSARIVRILRNSVVLDVDGREEVLAMKTRPSGSEARSASDRGQPGLPDPGRPGSAMATAPAPGLSKDVRDVLSTAQARPYFEGGKMNGFYLGRVDEGSLLKKFGLQTGDIIEGINDVDLQKPQDVNLLQSMKLAPGTRNVLKIKRQGKQLTLNLD